MVGHAASNSLKRHRIVKRQDDEGKPEKGRKGLRKVCKEMERECWDTEKKKIYSGDVFLASLASHSQIERRLLTSRTWKKTS
jgi:hypothetical protein